MSHPYGPHIGGIVQPERERAPEGLGLSVAAVSSEPIPQSLAADYMRVGSPQHAVLEPIVTAVREEAERITRRLFTRRQVTATWRRFYDRVALPRPPVGSVSSVETYDRDTDSYDAVAGADYDLIDGVLELSNGAEGKPVKVVYDAGYQSLPAALKRQMLTDIRYLYDHRDASAAQRVQSQETYQTFRPY